MKKGHYDSKYDCGCWTNEDGSFICKKHEKELKKDMKKIKLQATEFLRLLPDE